MNTRPKIFVFRMREIIYTLLLIVFAAVLMICLFLMFSGRTAPDQHTAYNYTSEGTSQDTAAQQTGSSLPTASSSVTSASQFTPGIYTTPLSLNGASLEVEVTVDADHINSIRLVNLSETAEAIYPLISPSLDHIATQILQKQSLDEITSPQENHYTSQMLLNAVSDALELAKL